MRNRKFPCCGLTNKQKLNTHTTCYHVPAHVVSIDSAGTESSSSLTYLAV